MIIEIVILLSYHYNVLVRARKEEMKMAYIGGRYRVWVYEDDLDISVRMIDNIETESQARAIANCEWVKPDTKAVKTCLTAINGELPRK